MAHMMSLYKVKMIKREITTAALAPVPVAAIGFAESTVSVNGYGISHFVTILFSPLH